MQDLIIALVGLSCKSEAIKDILYLREGDLVSLVQIWRAALYRRSLRHFLPLLLRKQCPDNET